MKAFTVLLATFHTLSFFATAHPFIIIHTDVTEVRITQRPVPTAHILPRQGILDDLNSAINSALGVDDDGDDDDGDEDKTTTSEKEDKTTSSASTRTLVAPAVASTTDSSEDSKSTSTKDDGKKSASTSETSTRESSTSATSTESSTTSESTATSTSSASSTTAIPASTTSISQPTATTESSNDSSDGVPPGGVAVAVIMSLLIVAVTAWLIFRYHPRCQAWWALRKEREFRERSYRDALDGPNSGSPNLREQALGSAAISKRQTLKSFFVPATARLGAGQEIKRKPVNWGVSTTPSTPRSLSTVGEEKLSMTASAAPMGQIERYSVQPKELPADEGLGLAPAPLFSGKPSPKSATPANAAAPVPSSTAGWSVMPPVVSAPTTPIPSRAPTNASTRPVSPISMHPQQNGEPLPPVSPMSTHTRVEANSTEQRADRQLPPLPPVPTVPGLVHAKRGSDGVFRLK